MPLPVLQHSEPSLAPPSQVGAPPARRERLILCAIVAGVLAVFAGKAFTIDEPLFLWLGEHLQKDPVDFFGFGVNWYSETSMMHEVTMNPPLVGYYIALVAAVFGWSEVALRLAFVLPALATALGTYALARRLTARPLEASLIGVLTPVFLVCSTSVMCDTTMLGFWCWSLWCWIRGFDTGRARWLWSAAALAGLAGLTKYFGVSLLPLLLAYGFARERRAGRWMLPLVLPLVLWGGYELATRALYGRGLLLGAASFATEMGVSHSWWERIQVSAEGLAFAGGCLASIVFYAPIVGSRAVLAVGALLLAAGVAVALGSTSLLGQDLSQFDWTGAAAPLYVTQFWIMLLAGVGVLVLALTDLRRARDPDALLLALWVGGTFVFATFVNWTNNGRSNLPMAPALGILLVRRLEILESLRTHAHAARRLVPLAASAALGILVAYGDARWATDVRSAAREMEEYQSAGSETYFQGHWGFQWYMEAQGARSHDMLGDIVEVGDYLIMPTNNANLFLPDGHDEYLDLLALKAHPRRWFHTVNFLFAANFYASNFSTVTLPFVIGPPSPFADEYAVFRAKRRFWLEQ